VNDSASAGASVRLGTRTVRRVGYGTMRLIALQGDPAAARALLETALDLGVSHFDTAEYYGHGFASRLLRDVVGNRPGVVIATKVGAVALPGGPMRLRPAQRPEDLRAGVHANLRTLGTDRLDLVNLRRHDEDPATAVDIDDQVGELARLRDEGLVDNIGLSAVDEKDAERVLPAGIACIQNQYSLLDREDEPLLALCERQGIAWVPYFPLGGGGIAGARDVVGHPALQEQAAGLGITPSQLGLAWLLHRSPAIALIPGSTRKEHLIENLAVPNLEIPAETLAQLDLLGGRTR
jgi:pyridoxine 4-dehydrogenase